MEKACGGPGAAEAAAAAATWAAALRLPELDQRLSELDAEVSTALFDRFATALDRFDRPG